MKKECTIRNYNIMETDCWTNITLNNSFKIKNETVLIQNHDFLTFKFW